MSHCNILEMKLGNDNLWNPKFVVLKQGLNCNSQKDMKIIKGVEMGHNINNISYNYNIKEMKTKLKLRESGKYKRER